ncbi:MAG TPA: DUF58 domain-containing protein [Thermodesulfobacteriota bacterium]|nr:DUF58 domain-containing protein [Thermodesulfobacteriota bacterium]
MNPFDPRVLARLKNLSLRARTVVDGVMVGIHSSRAKGFSSEFEGHREYTPGDEVQHIDWKAYGKFDRYFIKEYQETTHLRAYIVLDTSGSMGYASNGVSKFDYGATLATSLSYLLLKQQDAVGLVLFSRRIERMIPPKAVPGHFWAIVKALEDGKPGGETSGGEVLAEVAGSLKRRGLIVLISDLLDEPEKVLRGLRQIRSRGSDVIVFHLLDRDELDFPFDQPALFQDMEENLRLAADPQVIRNAYLETLRALLNQYQKDCASNFIDYHLFPTSIGLDKALTSYLTWRKNLKK